ncbi:MAG: DsbA family protein [Myxococcales bacterium]|nr:DsbA family protein [Myxococcales bacterium]
MQPIRVIHFSDVLCVWAYVSQVRVDELREKLGDRVDVEVRFCSIFGDAHHKLERRWKDRGGMSGYGATVRDLGESLGHEVHPDIWRKMAPRSSLSAHTFLCAVRSLERTEKISHQAFLDACWELRVAFFRDLRDISTRSVQLGVAEGLGLPVGDVERALDSGEAHAELAGDFDLGRDYDVRMSPTLILNEGRQRLNGNVSFRVIEANVAELVRQQGEEQCSNC